jgi:hypothetical protein
MLVFHKVLPEKKMLETDSVMPQITFARNIEHIITDIHVDNTLRNIEVFFFFFWFKIEAQLQCSFNR